MSYSVGQRIKDLREYFNVTQKELCDGICSQGLISRIEKDEVSPTAVVLEKIAKRLSVDMNYFFDDIFNYGNNYVEMMKNTIDKKIRECHYEEVLQLITLEKNSPLFKSDQLKQYMLWREAICIFHVKHDEKRALELLDSALKIVNSSPKIMSEYELHIYQSKAIIYSMTNKLELAAEIYKTLVQKINSLTHIKHKRLMINIYYNAGLNAYDRQDYAEALNLVDQAIALCIEEDYLYLLGQLFFLYGIVLFDHDHTNKEESLKYLDKALFIFTLKNNQAIIENVHEEKARIENVKATG
ncbi:helix-turn-helix domain-containing protein [Alkalihalobacterium elongatum]|uniref:helix-turn-helix domain-containing protein n=1 Tax=Alkalihalobacterium elongatum TaxID=2675466 RepID=UPI001C1F9395|nr:helix-turn-helix domain-containing protein [Alkalihalobacterium elongatum]